MFHFSSTGDRERVGFLHGQAIALSYLATFAYILPFPLHCTSRFEHLSHVTYPICALANHVNDFLGHAHILFMPKLARLPVMPIHGNGREGSAGSKRHRGDPCGYDVNDGDFTLKRHGFICALRVGPFGSGEYLSNHLPTR